MILTEEFEEYLNQNPRVKCIISDHWKSLELIKTNKKKICLIHSKEINHKKGSRLNKKVLEVLNNVDHVIANSNFTKNEKLFVSVKTQNDNSIVTTFYSDRAKPFVKKYKFIKGFEDGSLDFSSTKINNISKSKLIIDYKYKKLP